MDAQAISKAEYLDIIYDNRNKLYGGYLLRKTQGRREMQALMIMVSFILAFCIWTFIDARNAHASALTVKKTDTAVVDLKRIKEPIVKPEPPKELPKELAATKPTIKNPVPLIRPDETVITQPLPVDSFAGRESGPVSSVGKPGGTAVTKMPGSGDGDTVMEEPVKIESYVSEMPEFPGNIYAYLAKSVKYPPTARENGIEGRVVVNFVVNEDGHISNAVVKRGIGGGCNDEALRVINSMPAWKPGKQNGRPVKVYYTLPINFKLE